MAGSNFFSPLSDGADAYATSSDAAATGNGGQGVWLAKCSGVPASTANIYEKGCLMIRYDNGSEYHNTGTLASPTWTLFDSLAGPATSLVDSNGVTAVDVGTTAAAVNNLRVTNSAAGVVSANAVLLSAVGTDAAISLSIVPKAATGLLSLGLSTGTGDITVGSSSGAQSVKIGNGAGVSTVNLANVSVAGANVNVASAVTGAGITDTVTISGGNAAATGIKVVNILTGTAGTSGNNRLTMGGGTTSAITLNGAVTSYTALNRCTGSAVANAPVATLVNASGSNVTVAAGLRITLTLAAGLQAGANTLNLNSHGADNIKSHRDGTSNIAAAYSTGGVVELLFDGTSWLDMSQ